MSTPGTYHHVQSGWVHWILFGAAAWCGIAALLFAEDAVAVWVSVGIATLFLGLAACFRHLTVRDETDALCVAFGPLEVAKRRVPYHEIRSVETARSTFIDGWGIHYTLGKGWIWNMAGYDCVRLMLADGKPLRIGTDEPQELAEFIRGRAGVP